MLRDPRVFVLAALAHLHLAWIHLFGDGNGRISRLLEFEILLRASIPVPAAHLLSDHYNKTRDHYYAILERTSRADGYPMEDFVHYAIEGLVDGLREQLQKILLKDVATVVSAVIPVLGDRITLLKASAVDRIEIQLSDRDRKSVV